VWEDLELDIKSDEHYGVCMKINVPAGVKLSISSLRVTAVLKPDDAGKALIADNGDYIRARGIRLPADPNWAEQLAAHELRVNVYLVSGAVLPVFAGGGGSEENGYTHWAAATSVDAAVKRGANEPAQRNGPRIPRKARTFEV